MQARAPCIILHVWKDAERGAMSCVQAIREVLGALKVVAMQAKGDIAKEIEMTPGKAE